MIPSLNASTVKSITAKRPRCRMNLANMFVHCERTQHGLMYHWIDTLSDIAPGKQMHIQTKAANHHPHPPKTGTSGLNVFFWKRKHIEDDWHQFKECNWVKHCLSFLGFEMKRCSTKMNMQFLSRYQINSLQMQGNVSAGNWNILVLYTFW